MDNMYVVFITAVIFTNCVDVQGGLNKHEERRKGGEFRSSRYPKGYGADEDITWVFSQSYGIWLVKFNDVDIRRGNQKTCSDDYLSVSDNFASRRNIKVCGNTNRKEFISIGNSISIRFQSGFKPSLHERGFRLSVYHGKNLRDIQQKIIQFHLTSSTSVVHLITDHRSSHWLHSKLLTAGLSVSIILFFFIILLLALSIIKRAVSLASNRSLNKQQIVMVTENISVPTMSAPRRFSKPSVVPIQIDNQLPCTSNSNFTMENDYIGVSKQENHNIKENTNLRSLFNEKLRVNLDTGSK